MELPVLNMAPNSAEVYEDPLEVMDQIEALKKERDATILSHFYTDGDLQEIADFTGDSLKLARDATRVTTSTIVFCGVHFMGESAKILNPEKRVLMPDLQAGCSLADSCPADQRQRSRDHRSCACRQRDLVCSRSAPGTVSQYRDRPKDDSLARFLHGS